MRYFLVFLLLVLLLPFCTSVASAASRSVIQQIGEEEKQLEKINQELSQLTDELNLLKKKEETNLKRLDVINLRLNKFDRELHKYDANIEAIREESLETERKIRELKKETAKQREELKERLNALYKQSSVSDLELFFTSKGMKNFRKNKKYLELLTKKDMEKIDAFDLSIKQLNELQQQMDAEIEKIKQFKDLSMGKRAEILNEKRNKSAAIKEIEKEKDYYFAKKKRLENAGMQIKSLLADLMEKKVEKKEETINYKDFSKIKGKMSWPIAGKIITHFGKEKNEVFGTYLYHNGVEIVSESDITVRSVFKGKVLFTGPFENFGNMVVISHGQGYYSLYAYLVKSYVKVGEVVDGGEKIAAVGENPKIAKPTLYFEIRKRGNAIDPEKWLH